MGEDRGLGVRVKKEKEGFRRGRGDGRPVRKIFFDSKIYFAPRRIQLFIAPHRRNVLPSPEKDDRAPLKTSAWEAIVVGTIGNLTWSRDWLFTVTLPWSDTI